MSASVQHHVGYQTALVDLPGHTRRRVEIACEQGGVLAREANIAGTGARIVVQQLQALPPERVVAAVVEARCGDTVVGICVVLEDTPSPPDVTRRLFLDQLYVATERRGRGIAHAMVAHLIAYMRVARGSETWELVTRGRSYNLWSRHGFLWRPRPGVEGENAAASCFSLTLRLDHQTPIPLACGSTLAMRRWGCEQRIRRRQQ